MLVGRLPFDDPSPASLAIKHITDEPPAPRQINPDLSPEVEAVLLKALRKLPEERYQTGKELIDALESTVTSPPAHKDSTQSLDRPPSTLTVLPGIAENLRPPTISRLAALDLYSGDAQTPPTVQAVSESVGKTPVEVNFLRQWISTHKLVFFSFLAVGVLSMLFGSILVPRWLFWSQNLPTQTSSAVGLPDPLVYQERATSTAVISTRVGIPKYTDPTRNSTISPTGTLPPPTPTIGPAATPFDEGEIHLTIAKHKEDSLFVINQGTTDIPLTLIRFGNKDGEVIGEQWGVDVLHPGQCAGVWKKEGNPEVPKEIQCESVGEQLVISEKKFWNSNLEVYFKDLSVGVCDKKDLCELSFVSFP
jgi:serine/threonine protein kinase